MYKVFVNDKPLFLTNEIAKETDFQRSEERRVGKEC